MAQNGKLMPNLDRQRTKNLNLTVLQRIDPCIEDILLTAAHVSLYEFNIDLNQWSRKDVEGSLFVVRRNAEPWYQFIVMNRRNTENLVENLSEDFEYEIQKPYLLYKNAAQEVNGIWFYNTRECEEVANLIDRVVDSYSRISPNPQVYSTSDFKELESVPSMAVIEGPLEPSPVSTIAADVNEMSSSFANFFNTATGIGNNGSYSGRPVQTYNPPSTYSTYTGRPNLTADPAGPLQPPSVPQATNGNNQIANIFKPSSFYIPRASSPTVSIHPVPSSMPPIAPQPSLTLQRPYGAPMLQPFPPPIPSSSFAPHNAIPLTYGPVIDKDKVRVALATLVQDNQFIDTICRALEQVHRL